MANLNKIRKLGLAGFVACVGSYYLFQTALSKKLINSQYCQDAMELVKNHSGAKGLLGEPIEPIKGKFYDYQRSPATSTVEVLVSGPKSRGKLFFTINKNSGDQPELGSVQLQIGADDSKRLEIKSEPVSNSL